MILDFIQVRNLSVEFVTLTSDLNAYGDVVEMCVRHGLVARLEWTGDRSAWYVRVFTERGDVVAGRVCAPNVLAIVDGQVRSYDDFAGFENQYPAVRTAKPALNHRAAK